MIINTLKKTALTTIAVAILATGVAAPAQAAGPASLNITNSVFDAGEAEVLLVGGKHRKGKRFGHRRHRHGGHGWGHYYHKPHYGGGCFWRKKRFFDGYGYYYRKVRVCF